MVEWGCGEHILDGGKDLPGYRWWTRDGKVWNEGKKDASQDPLHRCGYVYSPWTLLCPVCQIKLGLKW